MADEENKDESGIVRPVSAYHHYSRLNSSKVKEELIREGKDTALGAIVSVVAARWKTLPEEEKNVYENLAREDRDRYDRECSIRDEEVLQQQEERRRMNSMTATDTKLRGSTIANTDMVISKSEVKRTRELSEKEKEQKEIRKKAKNEETSTIKAQHNEVKAERARQAEARLKYLLGQSDIFAHFGSGKTSIKAESSTNSTNSTSTSSGRRSHRTAIISDDLDEDEKALLDDEEEVVPGKNTILLKQPRTVSGGEMRSYQLEGLNWMIKLQENGINGILADEMGLGKTLQSISILAYTKEYRNIPGPHLVIVPKSTLSNWMNEFTRWTPSIRTLKLHGSKEEREVIISNHMHPARTQDEREWDVLITTYEVMNLEKNAFTKIAWRYLIIDEAHRLKNEDSQFAQTVRLLNTQYRLLLTGTPLQNNLHELWALLNFLLPDVFASSEQFDEWFNLDVDDLEAKQRIISQLHKLLRPFMLRRLKADVETSLPPKTETILFTGLSEVQKKLYRDILKRDIDTVNGTNSSRTAVLNIVMQLRKCCNHPYLFPGVEDRTLDPLGDHLFMNCGKMVLLDKLLAKLQQRGHRVLIFSQMTRMLDIMEDYFLTKGYQYCRIDGNTTYEEREDRIQDFNRPNSDKFVFLLSTRAGGLGINLQTADTVILYDSDWNPQADLQAQDRAHRIGQKKPVQVFRLVTDDTVEVKVVERAQQKLKLDAMVVQQGRLQEKERKLSKQELLETIRFGADKIFRSKESTITDDDIDLILEQGRKRTMEMNEKLQVADKGDVYDFRLDGGMKSQIFEGKDYSDKNQRESDQNFLNFAFIDPGKRERRPIATYSETIPRTTIDDADKKPKLPRNLRLPKMEDWQFYDKQRLQYLQDEELRLFDIYIAERGDQGNTGITTKIFSLLPAELHQEKTQLLKDAFDWTRVQFNNFIRASAKHGRYEYEKIAKDIHKNVDETRRYSETFWLRGPNTFPPSEWERTVKSIEKGEKRLEEIERLTNATAKLISMFDDPWEELTFRNVGNQGRMFNAVEDRFLLCLTHLHGYGSWDLVRSSIRRCEVFRFDFYLQSCSSEALGKRCEILMRSAERELGEIERKRLAADSAASNSQKPRTAAEINRDRLADLEKQIDTESRRLANVRAQLNRIKVGKTTEATSTAATAATAASTSAQLGSSKDKSSKKPLSKSDKIEGGTEKRKGPPKGSTRGGNLRQVPEGLLPELCKLLKASGNDGITKVVNQFLINHPNYAKRQIEMKINEVAVKEKRGEDRLQVWHIQSEFQKYLGMENFESEETTPLESAGIQTKEASSSSSSSSSKPSKKVRVNVSESLEKQDVKGPLDSFLQPQSSNKRKLVDMSSSSSLAAVSSSSSSAAVTVTSSSDVPKEPKKLKRAFGFFVKAKRSEAEARIQDSSNTEELRKLLLDMWTELPADERQIYEQQEEEDKIRYEEELNAWNEYKTNKKRKA